MRKKTIDVLVVGAGPVGLFCANELLRHGLQCRIIDQKETLSHHSKALGLHIRTLEMFKDSGLIDTFSAQGHEVKGVIFKSNRQTLANATFADIEANRHSLIDLPQAKTEKIFFDALLNKSAYVEWQTKLLNFETYSDHISATLQLPDGTQDTIECAWLIACDGAHSTVRHATNMPFEGAPYQQRWWLADLLIDWALPADRMVIYLSEKGPIACFPMGNKRYRLVMTAPPGLEQDPELSDIENEFKNRGADKATFSHPIWLSKFFIHHRQIQQYRKERIFFAGDSAHIHSPLGGQGLNTGLQDIYNLVWKLALVHKGKANQALLDSYHLERHPVGKQVLEETDRMTKLILLKNRWLILLRNAIFAKVLSIKWVRNKLAYRMAELDISYAKSPIVDSEGALPGLNPGTFLADFFLKNHQKTAIPLHQIIQGTQHHLFLFQGLADTPIDTLQTIANWVEKKYGSLIKTHIVLASNLLKDGAQNRCAHQVHEDSGTRFQDKLTNSVEFRKRSTWLDEHQTVHEKYQIQQPSLILMRPDKYIGFLQTPVNLEKLQTYLHQILQLKP